MPWETGGSLFFTAGDRLDTAMALEMLSKTVRTSAYDFADLEPILVDSLKTFRAAVTSVEKKIEQKNGLVFIAITLAFDALNDDQVARKRVAAADKQGVEL